MQVYLGAILVSPANPFSNHLQNEGIAFDGARLPRAA
jgi:hypothetical protein